MTRPIRITECALVSFALCIFASTASASSEIQLRVGPARTFIQNLHLYNHPKIVTRAQGDILREYVLIPGSYPRKNWNLIIGHTRLIRDRVGRFIVKTLLNGPRKILTFAAVAPDGQVQTEQLEILYPDWRIKKIARWGLSGGLGYTALTYTEAPTSTSEGVDISEKAITGKVSYQYRFGPPRWDLGVTIYATAAVLNSTIPGSSIRFLGANFRVGYTVPGISEPWALILMGGVYYTTTFTSPGNHLPFGFQNLMGPQLFPVIRRSLGQDSSLIAYFKFSPVGNGGFVLQGLGSRELAVGLTYDHRLFDAHFLPISLDFANLKSNIDGADIESTSLSLSLGYTL